MKTKTVLFGTLAIPVCVLDFWSKKWALTTLGSGPITDFMGGYVPLTLAFNKGAAFGISIGDDSRWLFIPLSVFALGLLLHILYQCEERDFLRILACSFVIAGALGNLYDRIRWSRGVVDFIGPVDLGFMLWPIFNMADMAISCGAFLLAISFWNEEEDPD
ncbi:MAG: signal peptidase II [Gemmatimonadetes bacterium]|nr:signal peptidase II [Gemmatimonadota bacterium]